jgi:two-component system, NarL family, nitrate/nitrite response regulator NarL
MEKRVSTIIIEPRLVLREALELLMGNHCYRVVGGLASIGEITCSSVKHDGPELVILGAQAADDAAEGAQVIRTLWPDSKIIFLFDDVSPADFQNMLASQVDGCIPLSVSPAALMSALDLIMTRNVRIMVMGDTNPALKCPQVEPLETESESARLHSNGDSAVTVFGVPPLERPANEANICNRDSCTGQAHVVETKTPTLSEREIQVLDGLVKGDANKVIARRCGVTEATVKVHMESILRKIRVGNRTQAAIWALEHSYSGEGPKAAALKANGVAEQTYIVPSPAPTARQLPRLALISRS